MIIKFIRRSLRLLLREYDKRTHFGHMKSSRQRWPRAFSSSSSIFYIQAPGYTTRSGGIMACHVLCHELNRLGYETYVAAPAISRTLWTPMLTGKIARAHRKAGRRPIAIYPEIYTGNELNCDFVIRYLLNKPGARSNANPDFWQSPSRKSEFHIHHAEEFRLPHLNSVPLYTPRVDESIFFEEVGANRDGFLVYSHRREVHDAMVPHWARPYILVSMASPRSPRELADLYRRSRGLVMFERTSARMEAAMCGCPTVTIPSEGFSQVPMFHLYAKIGLGWGADVEQLYWAQRTLRSLQRLYRAQVRAYPAHLAEVVEAALGFFADRGIVAGQRRPCRSAETT
jgi:hypothetical protein